MSAVALALMVAGFIWFAVSKHEVTLPGQCGLLPTDWLAAGQAPPGLVLMSAGMILLGLLPLVRVGLALAFYLRQRAVKDALAAAAVVVILFISMLIK